MRRADTYDDLVRDNEELRLQLEEANDNIQAIRMGQVDAFVVQGEDGHQLFSLKGIPLWTPYVDAFLAERHLTLVRAPLALPRSSLTPPRQLAANGRESFEQYLRAGTHKAFAVTADGHFGWATGKRTVDEAETTALKFCEGAQGRGCKIVFVDDEPVP